MRLYGKGQEPLYGGLEGELPVDTPHDGMSQADWLKRQITIGEKELIKADELRKRKKANNLFTNVPRYLSMVKHKVLCASKKLILGDIIGFQQQNKKYYRSNKGIAEIFGLSEPGVRDHLRALEEMKLITKVVYSRSLNNSERYISANLLAIKSLYKS